MKILMVTIVCIICLFGCGRTTYSDYKADDLVSEAIANEVDGNDIYYKGSHINAEGIVYYEYLIIHEQQGQIEQIANAVNDVLETGRVSKKINIDCWIAIPGGASRVANLMNYSDESLENPDYFALQRLCISGQEDSIYTDPLTYTNLVGIRKLELGTVVQKKGESEKIDWYVYWPDLESVEILVE